MDEVTGMKAPNDWDQLLSAIIETAQLDTRIRGLILVGSRARADRPADEWSDLDLIAVSDDPDTLVRDEAWLEEIAPVWVTLVHPGPLQNAPVRQVVFENGFDVDLVLVGPGNLEGATHDPVLLDVIGRGWKVLLDKDELLARLDVPAPAEDPMPPTADEFQWAVNDLLFQLVWATKHLLRGEIWQAKDDVDCYMRSRLLTLIEWHAFLTGRHTATWAGSKSGGRHLERWADPRILEALPKSFASYETRGIAQALPALADLIRWVGAEIAQEIEAPYPVEQHLAIVSWMERHLESVDLG